MKTPEKIYYGIGKFENPEYQEKATINAIHKAQVESWNEALETATMCVEDGVYSSIIKGRILRLMKR